MQEKELELQGGYIYYILSEAGAAITRAGRLTGEVHLPETLEGQPVVEISKKAFLSQKKLTGIYLPDTIKALGEWAFAYCSALAFVRLPHKKMVFGKGAFLACERLREIACDPKWCACGLQQDDCLHARGSAERRSPSGLNRDEGQKIKARQTARLLAAAPVLLDAEYLLSTVEAGSREWLAKWDARMLELLRQSDLEGYTKMVLCGEEDLDLDQDSFQKEKRKGKVRLCLLRLMNPLGLKETVKQELTDYVLSHKKRSETEEAWEVVLQEHGDDREVFSFFLDMGGMTAENRDDMLKDMGEEHAEMKAYLLRYGQERLAGEDFFAGFSL